MVSMLANIFFKFRKNDSGQFAVLAACLSIPLLLSVGLAVDFARYSSSSRHLQALTDIAALQLANSPERDAEKLAGMAMKIVRANRDHRRIDGVRVLQVSATDDNVDLALSGDIPSMFMGIAGYDRLESKTSALAERAINGAVEVALVLDNTWSMSESDAKGTSRIAALKSAAASLVSELMKIEDGTVRIGLVPYADYVNVGTQHRAASWLDVPDDYTKPGSPRSCTKLDRKLVCQRRSPRKTCTRVVDGVSETYSCGGGCASYITVKVRPYLYCTGGGAGPSYSWYGCIGSRRKFDNRLHDNSPSDRYPGYIDTRYRCPNPIVPLTSSKSAVLSAIRDMQINRGTYYRPLTYIPAGLIWGHNILSPSGPLGSGQAYDKANTRPRKVVILMTDGENTLRFARGTGKHPALSGSANNKQKQLNATNSDTRSVCEYMKSKQIEIFSIAFMVDNPVARSLLEQCASDDSHYYDATDSEALVSAFKGIGESLRIVRLAR
jgi:hypothetical protein